LEKITPSSAPVDLEEIRLASLGNTRIAGPEVTYP
jgi:hypothetical protein